MPSDAQNAPARAWTRLGRARAPPRPIAADLLSLSPLTHALTTPPATPRTPPFPRPSAAADATIDDIRHGLPVHEHDDDATVHLFLCDQAHRDRPDLVNRAASMPCPFAAPNAGAMLDLTMRLGLDRSL
jgi:hypothetical protein